MLRYELHSKVTTSTIYYSSPTLFITNSNQPSIYLFTYKPPPMRMYHTASGRVVFKVNLLFYVREKGSSLLGQNLSIFPR